MRKRKENLQANMKKKSIYEHFEDLRECFLKTIFILFITFFISIFFSHGIIVYFVETFAKSGVVFISLSPFEILIAKIKLAFFLAFLISFPVISFIFFTFIKEGMKRKEFQFLKKTFLLSILIFYLGFFLSFFILIKISLNFFPLLSFVVGIHNYWSISKFISFMFTTSITIGLVFEIPVAITILIKMGIINREVIEMGRPFFIIFSFIIAAILTPPDILTQIIVALPLILFFEISIKLIK